MTVRMTIRPQRGFILIFAIWVLALLTVLVAGLASGVRQKIIFVDKLDERSRMQNLLQAALARTKAHVRRQLADSQGGYTVALKTGLHNNPEVFGQIPLGEDSARVSFTLYDGAVASEQFGVVDEERKINLNKCNSLTLQRLLERVFETKMEEAQQLARSILDWRQVGEGEVSGFYSDEYYPNLQYPYP